MSVAFPRPASKAPRITLDCFDGPLELLLHLIMAQEVDIWSVSLAEVCDQYIGVLDQAKELDIEVGSEFLVIAALLLEIKSARILPSGEVEEVAAPDPRQELLVQVIAFRDARRNTELLRELESTAAVRYPRGYFENLREVRDTRRTLNGWDLYKAWTKLREATLARAPRVIMADPHPPAHYRERILRILKPGRGCSFRTLAGENATRTEVVATLLALLELVREGLVLVWQGTAFGEIAVSLPK